MELFYGVNDRPKIGKLILFSLQQLLAILAATIVVPVIINGNITGEDGLIAKGIIKYAFTKPLSQSAALFGAGVGTLVYLLFTKFKSPVFLGSSFAFLGSMTAAFAGAVSMSAGYLGLIIGAVLAGLVYVVIAIVVKFCGTKWINYIMPAVVIGPTVAIIGLSLAKNAVGDLINKKYDMDVNGFACLICGLVTLGTTIACSVFGKKTLKMIPFIIGICAGYVIATIFTVIGKIADKPAIQLINFAAFKDFKGMEWYPKFTFIEAFRGHYGFDGAKGFFSFLGTIAVAYVPVAFVVFAEHIADHKNLSTIINTELLEDPGLHRTLLGDGVGSMAGAVFGGCPNTTYGESIGCVAISGNASVISIAVTACMAIVLAFIAPFTTFLASIPTCVMGGVCIALYGFIAVSGLKMIKDVDLGDNKNLFVVSVILIAGVGGLELTIGKVLITNIACALILGILVNLLVNIGNKKADK